LNGLGLDGLGLGKRGGAKKQQGLEFQVHGVPSEYSVWRNAALRLNFTAMAKLASNG
jgi:hypothetical protein